MKPWLLAATAVLSLGMAGAAQAQGAASSIDARAKALEPKLLAWRRDIHQHPELGNRETRTAKLVADHLRKLGMEVTTGVAGTGVVGVLKGARPGPTVALRADMDALPVEEKNDLPFRSRATSTYEGKTVPVMHACGHDTHVAMLMTTAELLAGMKNELPGTVKFIFQPAEEGSDITPPGKQWSGARQMVAEGVMKDVDAIFGMHVFAGVPSGRIAWRPGPTLASSDLLKITVQGRQTHGARPWGGVDPIVVGSQIVLGLQTIASRQVEVTKEPSIITIGQFQGGVRNNIIPDEVVLTGTIRAFDEGMQADIHQRIKRTAEHIAEAAGAKAVVEIKRQYPVTINNGDLTTRMEPTLKRVAGPKDAPGAGWAINDKVTGAEDFSFYDREAPGLFLILGVTPPDQLKTAASNHSPQFMVHEPALLQGVRAMSHVTWDYLSGAQQSRRAAAGGLTTQR
jgi:amidohydrolase